MSNTDSRLPHWDMTVVYPELDSPEFEVGFRSAGHAVDGLQQLFDENRIAKPEFSPDDAVPAQGMPVTDAIVQLFDTVMERINQVMEEVNILVSYMNSFVATDSRNALAQARWSEFQQHGVRLSKLGTRMTAWAGSLDVEALIRRSQVAQEHAYALRKAKIQAQHLMSPDEEELAAELSLTGSSAWSKLYGNFTSQLSVTLDVGNGPQELPMSSVRNLAYHPDRDVRRRAYQAELATWERAALPIAAAMNGIKGEVNTLAPRRDWASPLEASLFDNNMDRASLDAMMEAAWESFPDFRRYLRAKARVLGLQELAWYDIFAPVSTDGQTWSFDETQEFIIAQFATFSPRMEEMARRAFDERWIDAEPRTGKRDGAFCMRLRRDESRILANYKENFNSVSTLAHELGHAYHNLNLAHRTVTQKITPMTLAETASIFCETIVKRAALARADPQEQLVILETSLQNACQVVVDITSRFLFEQNVFEKRRQRELSPDEFSAIMVDAQRQTYGDGLDSSQLHAFMWAAKSHYYGISRLLYNYPYMFGLLFALGLYARYEESPDEFRASYDDLLSSTGMDDAAALAARFGIDIRRPAFWRSSLDVIRDEIDRFDRLTQG